jgi:hypothetical protein
MRNAISTLPFLFLVAILAGGCGGDSSTNPKDNGPATFSKLLGDPGKSISLDGMTVRSDGVAVVTGNANALRITGSATPLDGTGTSDVYVAGFKPDGSVAFRTFIPGSGVPIVSSMSRDANDALFVTGHFTANATLGTTNLANHGSFDAFMAKLDATGHPIWVVGAGGTGEDDGVDIAVSASNFTYVCGVVTDQVDVSGENCGVIGKTAGFLVQLNDNGVGQWHQTAEPAAQSACRSVTVSQNGSVVVCGEYSGANVEIGGVILPNDGTANAFIARFNENGDPLGTIRIGGSGNVIPAEVTTINNDVVVAGTISGTVDFDVNTAAGTLAAVDNDAFVARYTKTGELQWVKTFGTTGDQAATELTHTAAGDILVAGTFNGTFSAGSTVLTTSGFLDMFVVRLSGGGTVLAVKRARGNQDELPSAIASSNGALIVVGTTGSNPVTFPDGTQRTLFGAQDGFIYQQP